MTVTPRALSVSRNSSRWNTAKAGCAFLAGPKIPFHADMQLLRAALEPAASARAQDRRFLDLLHPQDRAIEISRRGFASFRRRDLNVIDARHA